MSTSNRSEPRLDDKVIEISDAQALPARPLVSVVMLAYRHEPFLSDAIEGVLLQQTDFPIELIIAEDCSPDRTVDIAKRYQREHPSLIRIITSGCNVGMMANFARAIDACRGEFIALCEGDDYWHSSDKLRRQVEVCRADPAVHLVHTAWNHRITWGGRDRVCRPRDKQNDGKVIVQDDALATLAQWTMMVMTCTSMFRTDITKRFFQSVRWNDFKVGDWPLFAWLAAHGKVAYINLSTSTYRRTPGSAMNSGGEADVARVRNAEIIHGELARALGEGRYPSWPRKEWLARQLYQTAVDVRDPGTLEEAREALEEGGIRFSYWRWQLDRLQARWAFAHFMAHAWPNTLRVAHRMIRYRPV